MVRKGVLSSRQNVCLLKAPAQTLDGTSIDCKQDSFPVFQIKDFAAKPSVPITTNFHLVARFSKEI